MALPTYHQSDSLTADSLCSALCIGSRCSGNMYQDTQEKSSHHHPLDCRPGDPGTSEHANTGLHPARQSSTVHHGRHIPLTSHARTPCHHSHGNPGGSHALRIPQSPPHIAWQILSHAHMGHTPIRHLDSGGHAAFLHPRHTALCPPLTLFPSLSLTENNYQDSPFQYICLTYGPLISPPTESSATRSSMQ